MNETKKHILITGEHGQVGWSLQQTCPNNITLIVPEENELDITKQADIRHAIKNYKPDFIINAAAFTAVDNAEKEKELAMQVNAEGPSLLAQHCEENKIPLFHYSTDYVFDGEKDSPYTEEDKPNPINVYGESKLLGEQNIQHRLEQHIILRLSGVFCSHGNNFVKTILRLSETKEELSVVSDQITCPTPAIDIATVTWKIIEKTLQISSLWGTYHYCASPAVSWQQFALDIIADAQKIKPLKIKRIKPITSAEYNSPAKRLANAVLSCKKIENTLGITQIPWHIELGKMIKEHFS